MIFQASADVAALDSAVAGNGFLRTTRRTDTRVVRFASHKKPRPASVAAVEKPDLVGEIRDMRLEALWLSGAITDDEYFALRQQAA